MNRCTSRRSRPSATWSRRAACRSLPSAISSRSPPSASSCARSSGATAAPDRTRAALGAQPTEAGRLLYHGLNPLLGAWPRSSAACARAGEAMAGSVRVGAVYSVGLHTLPPAMKRCLAEHPRVKVRLEYRRTDQVVRCVPRRRRRLRHRRAADAAAAARDRAAARRRAGDRRAARAPPRPPRQLSLRALDGAAVHRLRARHPDAQVDRSSAAPERRARSAT